MECISRRFPAPPGLHATLAGLVAAAALLGGCRNSIDVLSTSSGGAGGTGITTATSGGGGTPGGTGTGSTTGTATGSATGTATGSATGTPGGATTTTTTATGSSTGTPTDATCDLGNCWDCINTDCTIPFCTDAVVPCVDDPACQELNYCWVSCYDTCEGTHPAGGCHQYCIDTCSEEQPEGADLLIAAYTCLACVACPVDCAQEWAELCD